jgi:hypothetical protein
VREVTGKTAVLRILWLSFLDRRQDKRQWTRWQQAFCEFNLILCVMNLAVDGGLFNKMVRSKLLQIPHILFKCRKKARNVKRRHFWLIFKVSCSGIVGYIAFLGFPLLFQPNADTIS